MRLSIENMKDTTSVQTVREQFLKAGIEPLRVDMGMVETEKVPDITKMSELINLLGFKGFKVNTISKQFPVSGMSCASCVARVENTLKKNEGVLSANVNLATQTAQVEFLPGIIQPIQLKESIQSSGYDLLIDESDTTKEETSKRQQTHYTELKNRTLWAITLSIPLVILGMFYMDMPYVNYIQWILATPVVFFLGRSFFSNAWKQARKFNSNMDTLVALSTGIAYFFSVFNTLFPEFWMNRGLHSHVYFETASVVISFILLGKFLEENAKGKTSFAIKKLMGLQPKTVTLIMNDGETSDVPVSMVKPGNIIQVRPGDKIAVDGRVKNGNSYINESLISGEPVPVFKDKGMQVFAGTVNQQGSFQFVAEKVGSETLLSSIIRLVQQAQGSKAPVQKLVDKIAGIFVPVVILLAIVTFITWSLLGGENGIVQGVLSMVTVLVIACPCALGLATPTAIMVGIGKGAEKNILIKDAEVLETAYRLNVMVFDKTGTITEGRPDVENITWFDNNDNSALKSILYALEKASEHPLAAAVVSYLDINTPLLPLESVTNHPGKGICGFYKGKKYYVGNEKLLNENEVTIQSTVTEISKKWSEQGRTMVFFASDNNVLALISITDKINETAFAAIKKLEEEGIEIYMLTGDNRNTAKAVADKTGIRNYKAEMLPAEKAEFIKSLQRRGNIVGMTGDGINDSHALATADISIAMGKGSDIAMDAARMTIIGNNLLAVPMALRLSRKTVQTIRQNLFWAFIYNLVGIPIAAGILYPVNGFLLNPMIAGAAMALSSVSVVSNSLRLKFTR